MADNLEKYFKKHLTDDTPAEDNWNVPSEEVWEKAKPGFPKKWGIFIPGKYLYVIAALILAGLGLTLWIMSDTAPGTEEQKLANNPVESSTLNEKKEEIPAQDISRMDKITDEQQIQEEQKLSSEEIGNASTTPGKKARSTASLNTENSIEKKAPTTNKQQTRISFEYPTYPSEQTVTEIIHKLDPLSSEEFSYSQSFSMVVPEKKLLKTVDPLAYAAKTNFNNKNKVGIGLFFAPAYNTTTVTGDWSDGDLETGNMYLYSGNWGAEIRYYLSERIALVSGVERSEVKSWSRSEVPFEYNTSTEHSMPDGEKENTSPVPMATPFGKVNTEITYRFPGDVEIPNGEPMHSVLETHQEISYLGIPLGIEYQLSNASPLNWFATGGIKYNRAYLDATKFNSRILHLGKEMQVVGESMMSEPEYSRTYFSFFLGTGATYQLSDKFQINTSARYFKNLSRVNIQDNVSTNVQGFGLKIGFLYIF